MTQDYTFFDVKICFCYNHAGNRTLLQYDETTWKPLIQFYKDNKCVVDGSKFP